MAQPGHGDGLVRWLVGGLAAGGIVLGLLVGAYEIGYHRGKEHSGQATSAAATAPAKTTTPAAAPAGGAPVALGKRLFAADACSGCHSLDGTAGAGPTVAGLAGSRVELEDGSAVAADDAYLTTAITDPDVQIVKGYQKGVMSGAVAGFGLATRPQDVAALVAFIKAQR